MKNINMNADYYMDFVTRKDESLELAQAIADYTQEEVTPIDSPVTGYSVGSFFVSTNGIVYFNSVDGIEGLLGVLADLGFVSMCGNIGCEE